MENDDSKPSLATGMARRSVWFATIGGVLAFVCRIDAFGNTLQGALGLLAMALLIIACVFGFVALVRVTSEDRDAVLIPGVVGVLLGVVLTISLNRWSNTDWAAARTRALQYSREPMVAQQVITSAQTLPASSPPQTTETKQPASVVKYELPALEQMPGVALKIRGDAQLHQGEDAAVLRAWAAHLERIHAVFTNTLAVSNILKQANLLDPSSVIAFDEHEGMRRRGIANKYAEAWHELDHTISTFSGSFYDDLRKERVSSERTTAEAKAIMSFAQSHQGSARIRSLATYCEAEEQVGYGYNYACNSVLDYVRSMHNTPAAGPIYKKQMDDQLLNLKQAEQAAAEARDKAFPGTAAKL